METRLSLIISILALNFSISFASAETAYSESRPAENTAISLAPVSPTEAGFSNLLPEADASFALLTPVTPREASFDEEDSSDLTDAETVLNELAPVAPAEAFFDDAIL